MFVWNCELQLVFIMKYELDYEDLEVIFSQNSNIVQLCTLISESSVLKPCNLRKWTRDIMAYDCWNSHLQEDMSHVYSLLIYASP